MDRRTALALRQAYRRDAALLLQSPAVPSSGVCTSSGLSTKTSSKGVDDVLKANQPQTKNEETASAAAASSPFVPPSQDTTTKCKNTAGDGQSALHTLDLAGIGRHLVLRSSREFPAPPSLKGRRGTTAVNSGADDGQLRPEHYCAPCGNLFYSEGNATAPAKTRSDESGEGISSNSISATMVVRVRSISRGRTRRRRAARVRARQAAQDAAQRKDRGGGRQWGGDSKSTHGSSAGQTADGGAAGSGRAGGGHGHAVATYTQADIERRKANAQLYNVQDGTKHHCVVYTCGHCGNKTRLGGIDVATRERRRKGNVQDQQHNSRDSTSTHQRKKNLSKERGANGKAHTGTERSEQKYTQLNAIGGDFISLAPLSPAEPSKKQEPPAKANQKASSYSFQDKATQSKKAASASRLDQSSNRKRKKGGGSGAGSLSGGGKKNAGKKSKLMDFLSSLNG